MSFLQNVSFIISTNHFEELPVDIGKEIAFAGDQMQANQVQLTHLPIKRD